MRLQLAGTVLAEWQLSQISPKGLNFSNFAHLQFSVLISRSSLHSEKYAQTSSTTAKHSNAIHTPTHLPLDLRRPWRDYSLAHDIGLELKFIQNHVHYYTDDRYRWYTHIYGIGYTFIRRKHSALYWNIFNSNHLANSSVNVVESSLIV